MLNLPEYDIVENVYTSHKSHIFRARHTADGRTVILKTLNDDFPTPERIARFQHEFDITRRLNLPGVINAISLERSGNLPVMILEDFEGRSLAQIVVGENGHPNIFSGPLSLANFLFFAIQAAETLGQIHQHHIIHKDINPTNILLNPETGALKLIDFGLSTVLSRESQSFHNPNVLEGTLAYISPEQTGRMNRAIDYRTDFYSLGVTFYELLTGEKPFAAETALEYVHAHIARQPAPPHQHRPDIPPILSEIVLKLMAKNAEDRYQSAFGLKADLLNCQQQWRQRRQIERFPLGEQDVSEALQLPQKLYGREKQIKALLRTFERVSLGAAELMLITGQAGIGKSALVQEIYKPLTKQRGYFIEGKFEQFQRNIPYAPLIQAFRSLMQQILTESMAEIEQWRAKILAAVGQNGGLLAAVIPELAYIIGPQPPTADLTPAEAQNRFNLLFINFINVFTAADHPLVLFVDDWQWADTASLNLLRSLITAEEVAYLFILGAYRDNEVEAAHPVRLMLNDLAEANVPMETLQLQPLETEDVVQLCADALRQPRADVSSLAELVRDKTGGNPFFISEFLKSLYAEGLLTFESWLRAWQWDLGQIQQRNITDNVVELMAETVQKLGVETQGILKLAACIGNQFELGTLALVAETAASQTAATLQPALEAGLILPLDAGYKLATQKVQGLTDSLTVRYKFAHDRIHQAVYSLIPEGERTAVHGNIGQLLLAQLPAAEQERAIFDIVNHLNIGRVTDRLTLARLNLRAGERALASAAYGPAHSYLMQGLALLPMTAWEDDYALAAALHLKAATAAYLNADFAQMETLGQRFLQQAKTVLEKVSLYEVLIQAYTAQNEKAKMVQTGLQALALLGINLPESPGQAAVLAELAKTRLAIGTKKPNDLLNLPTMSDPYKQAAIRVMLATIPGAYTTYPTLVPLFILKMVSMSARNGNTAASSFGYAGYGLLMCGALGAFDTGLEFGELGLKVLERFNAAEFKSTTLTYANAFVFHWKRHYRETLPPLREAYQSGLENGKTGDATLAALIYDYHSYFIGRELSGLEREMAGYSQTMLKTGHTTNFNYNELYRQAALNLLGRADNPIRLVGEAYDRDALLPKHEADNELSIIFNVYLHEAILAYLFGDYTLALARAEKTAAYLDGAIASLASAVYAFYTGLIRLAVAGEAQGKTRQTQLKLARRELKKLKNWAKHAPMNYQHKYELVAAEQARVLGHSAAARDHYDRALKYARQNRFLNEEALANELAGQFYVAEGLEHKARHYLRDAYAAYRQWGAAAKLADLEARYPYFIIQRDEVPTATQLSVRMGVSSTDSHSKHTATALDIESIVHVSQAISGEIRLKKLLRTLLDRILENAGAQTGCLLLERDRRWFIEAQGSVDSSDMAVMQGIAIDQEATAAPVPASIVNFVARTQESVMLNNASAEGQFTRDPYIVEHQPKSVLCMPLLNRGRTSAILYLENNLATGAFTPDRLEVLNLLSATAAISIDNAHLYDDLAQANRQLEDYSHNLEKMVAERTEELQNAVAELDAFAHTVAHDLKSPLSGIIGYADLVMDEYSALGQAELEMMLKAIRRGGYRMRNIIDGLLTLAMTRDGHVEPEPIDMETIVAEVKDRFAYLVEQYAAEIKTQAHWPLVWGYGSWVEEVWANYLSNAIKYGGDPPIVELGADEPQEGMVRFWVRDNGAGIPAEKQAEVFTPFTRLSEQRLDSHGLGLSIVTRIVTKLGGYYGLESEEGHGSTFYFTLPLFTAEAVTTDENLV